MEEIKKLRTAVKIPVVESESGWGRKIDDYMVCLSVEDAKKFEKEFNSRNTTSSAPNWYMQVEGDPEPIDLDDDEMKVLLMEGRVWLSQLRRI